MRPYAPNISPQVAENILLLVADHMTKHGIAANKEDVIRHLVSGYQATIERVLYSNIKDNFRDAVVVALEDQTSMVSYTDRHRQALRSALSGAAQYVSDPDDLSFKIQNVAAHEEEDTNAFFRFISTDISAQSVKKGIREKGSAARFLASQHITYPNFVKILTDKLTSEGRDVPEIQGDLDTEAPKPKQDKIIVTYTAEEKPFAEFISRLEQAAESRGVSLAEIHDLTLKSAHSDHAACMALLTGAGYTGTENELASVVYGAGIVNNKRVLARAEQETPAYVPPNTEASVAEDHTAPHDAGTDVSDVSEALPSENSDAARVVDISPADLSPEEAISLVRNVTGLTDEFLSKLIGVTRPTVKSIALGKARTKVSTDGRKKLADHLHGMVTDLTRARDALMLDL